MNQRVTESKSVALPLGYTPVCIEYYTIQFRKNQEENIYFIVLTKEYRRISTGILYFINKKLLLLFQAVRTVNSQSQTIQVLFHGKAYGAEPLF